MVRRVWVVGSATLIAACRGHGGTDLTGEELAVDPATGERMQCPWMAVQ